MPDCGNVLFRKHNSARQKITVKWRKNYTQTKKPSTTHTAGREGKNINCNTQLSLPKDGIPYPLLVSAVWIRVTPGLKATKPRRSAEHPGTKGAGKSYLAELMLKSPIPCEVCTRAVPSGSRKHLQTSSGIGQTRVSKVHEPNIHEVLQRGQNLFTGAVASQPRLILHQSPLAHVEPLWQVPRFIPQLGVQS